MYYYLTDQNIQFSDCITASTKITAFIIIISVPSIL